MYVWKCLQYDIKHINRGDCRSLIACKTNARINAKLLF